ncbi:TetR family transcriptional regulator [Pseudonocardia hierapolitana]|uniref:TetR family transcriptional regulator n=1 Tax=Pseudonocardia hierapolitana TaxID=1128676 RepID=A0A561STE4_9PSEU|nr:TetR/AcrR family transcriptional regulator [Pseudonocardia hierapolitana]TWF78138.1 TetR family transcriptional regulator [Pseudonocardia hierapolitana]
MDARTRLLDAAKQLVWDRGVEATSPNMVLARSGVGQGSLYHHFGSKAAWAEAAITALAADLTAETDELFSAHPTGVEQLRAYLTRPRPALDGCRLGRLAFDPEIRADDALRAPISAYFEHLRALLRPAVHATGVDDTDGVVEAICAVVQGGYVTSRLSDDPDALDRACRGLLTLLGIPPH